METLKEKISKDYVVAFKAGEKVKKNLLGVIKAEITTKEKNTNVQDLADKDVLDILKSVAKKLKETLSLVDDAQSKEELAIVELYLPKQMSEDEIKVAVNAIIAETSAKNGEMGKVMGMFSKKHAGLADNKLVSSVIQIELSKL
jgi:uncharacterized protein YqeY